MQTIRKFFDTEKKEVEAKDAVSCQELILDDTGKVINDAWYYAEGEKSAKDPQ